ncbi:GTPase [Ciceribacter sp. L1K22]|uniref:GTPase n=1 Tax=Ciceribacter sp. L1K22 TaxID=2820275 RepID=UPI001ABEB8CF|nr:GTPase [Ciceribacter sp. L1K22]MBO3758358.1 GTPase [Ciceribacter sp. L1K22]
MSVHLSRYLKDFSAPAPMPEPELSMAFDTLDDPFPALDAPEPVDVEEERRKAYAEGYEVATAELTARYTAERVEVEAAHAEELKRIEEDRDVKWADAIARSLKRLAADLSAAVSDEVARGIAPFLEEEIATKAVAELAAKVEAAIIAGSAGTIVVKGPETLFEKLKTALPEAAETLRHVPADDLDLSVEIGEAVLVTRISAWTASLRKVMG